MKKNNLSIYKFILFVSISLFLGLACKSTELIIGTPTTSVRLNPTLAAMPTLAHATVTPGRLLKPVCASYFQTAPSGDFIQGTWTDDLNATESIQTCYAWMENAIFNKKNCAQPQAKSIIVVLIDESRHSFDLPDNLNLNTEFIAQKECPTQ